jgi:hypothetical protein
MPGASLDNSLWSALANFGVMVLAALGLKGRIDALAKAVVYKDTCKVCGGGIQGELQEIKQSLSKQHQEQVELIKLVYKNLPKRKGDD